MEVSFPVRNLTEVPRSTSPPAPAFLRLQEVHSEVRTEEAFRKEARAYCMKGHTPSDSLFPQVRIQRERGQQV